MIINRGPVDLLYGCFWSDNSACLGPVRPVANGRFTFLTGEDSPRIPRVLRSTPAFEAFLLFIFSALWLTMGAMAV